MRAATAILLFLSLAHPASAEMVKWMDASGTVHFAESVGEIPPEFRTEAQAVPSYSPDDDRVRIVPREPEPEEKSGWLFGFGGGSEPEAKARPGSEPPAASAPSGPRVPDFSFLQGLSLIVVQFFVSIFVLAACAVLIGEKPDNLGGKAFGSIFAQRFLMFAAFLWIAHTTTLNFVPSSMTLGDLARVLVTPILAELLIMTVILRYTICDVFPRAIVLSVVFCTVDAMAQGLLFFGAVILAS